MVSTIFGRPQRHIVDRMASPFETVTGSSVEPLSPNETRSVDTAAKALVAGAASRGMQIAVVICDGNTMATLRPIVERFVKAATEASRLEAIPVTFTRIDDSVRTKRVSYTEDAFTASVRSIDQPNGVDLQPDTLVVVISDGRGGAWWRNKGHLSPMARFVEELAGQRPTMVINPASGSEMAASAFWNNSGPYMPRVTIPADLPANRWWTVERYGSASEIDTTKAGGGIPVPVLPMSDGVIDFFLPDEPRAIQGSTFNFTHGIGATRPGATNEIVDEDVRVRRLLDDARSSMSPNEFRLTKSLSWAPSATVQLVRQLGRRLLGKDLSTFEVRAVLTSPVMTTLDSRTTDAYSLRYSFGDTSNCSASSIRSALQSRSTQTEREAVESVMADIEASKQSRSPEPLDAVRLQ